jgi:hypothetical protein
VRIQCAPNRLPFPDFASIVPYPGKPSANAVRLCALIASNRLFRLSRAVLSFRSSGQSFRLRRLAASLPHFQSRLNACALSFASDAVGRVLLCLFVCGFPLKFSHSDALNRRTLLLPCGESFSFLAVNVDSLEFLAVRIGNRDGVMMMLIALAHGLSMLPLGRALFPFRMSSACACESVAPSIAPRPVA